MCLIVVKPKGIALPSDTHLIHANSNNDDGIGVAVKYADKNRVHIKKDFKTVVEFIKWMHESVKAEDTMIIHFRWATSGKNDMGNRHPFPITRNKDLLRKVEVQCGWAVAHNGVLSNYSGHKKYSDTQKFTLDILASQVIKDNLRDKTIQKMLEDFIGSDKLALLNEDGTVIRIGNFTKDSDGCYYSNDTYKHTRYIYNCNQYDAYGGGYFGGSYHHGIISSPVKKRGEESNPIVSQGTIFFDHCDGCGRKKKLMEVTSKSFPDEVFYLCKSCRKQYKKGKLERLDEELADGIEYDNVPVNEAHPQCDGCLERHPKEEMVQAGEFHYCNACCTDWAKLTTGEIENIRKERYNG